MQFRDVRPSSGFHACRSDLLERRCREKLPAPQSGRHERRLLVHWPSVRGLPPAPYHSNAQWPTLLLREAYRQTFHPTILACARRHHRHLRICRKREPSVLKLQPCVRAPHEATQWISPCPALFTCPTRLHSVRRTGFVTESSGTCTSYLLRTGMATDVRNNNNIGTYAPPVELLLHL